MSKKMVTPPKKAKNFWNKHVKRGVVVRGVNKTADFLKDPKGAIQNLLAPDEVGELQDGLNQGGANPRLKVDKFYGPKTAQAVKNYNNEIAAGGSDYRNEEAV